MVRADYVFQAMLAEVFIVCIRPLDETVGYPHQRIAGRELQCDWIAKADLSE